MPFGIKNAPAHFQRMMDTIFQEEILEGWIVVYIDDIIIYSETWEDHVNYIEIVLSKCTPINLKISLEKCNFGKQELMELGNKVSGVSLTIDKNKVASVMLKPVQKTIHEMQYFLVFDSYYRSHIRSSAHITSSLYKLCSKDVVFEITKERRDSYKRIKNELTNSPVLILPDFELSQPQRMTLLHWCCGNSKLGPSWGQLVTPYLYGQFFPLWCSMFFWPYRTSLANFLTLKPQASIFVFGPPSPHHCSWATPFH
ncbi:hypothetical protein O181_059272 [Austropuccinia psidii MF-1]|uniref:Reverse transcriptase domain-containing protein n=1 Tax=Austropuccinia psidii MF-1 TaxID=1389203 RepID=A0A9Q3ELC0_9BASI|nr:hypothetical protein [Austropuccinia psidii MF-1]